MQKILMRLLTCGIVSMCVGCDLYWIDEYVNWVRYRLVKKFTIVYGM